MAKISLFNSIGIAIIGALCMLQAQPTASQEKHGVIPHAPLLKSVLPDTANQEVAVYETEYAPGGINPRHLHPAAITFYVLSGAGVWQEEGKPPVTLKAGTAYSFQPEQFTLIGTPAQTSDSVSWNLSWLKRTRDDQSPNP
jgi:quercetin dioxygenase-like cupin family protein